MLITFTSAKGAPGVTTTVLGTALAWPNPVMVVEADTSGSSILPGALRGQVPYTRGIVPLVGSEITVEELKRQTIPFTRESLTLLPGIQRPSQSPALIGAWDEITAILKSLESAGVDVLVDLGRSRGTDDERAALLWGADLNILVTSSRLPDIAVTAATARQMPQEDSDLEALTPSRLLVVGPGRPYAARDIAKQIGLPLLESVAWDPVNAEHLSVGKPASKRFASSSLMRSLTSVGEASRAAIARRRTTLGQEA